MAESYEKLNPEAEEMDEEAYNATTESTLRTVQEAAFEGRDWCIHEEMLDRAAQYIAGLETSLEIMQRVRKIRELTPIKQQKLLIESTSGLEQIIAKAENLYVSEFCLQAARKLIATCRIEFWLHSMMHRLEGLEIATDAFEHDIKKLGEAVEKAKARDASIDLVSKASVLFARLTAELEGSRALQSIPVVRLPMENPPDGYYQDTDKGRIVETEGFPLPPEGGTYVWEPAQTFSQLHRSIEKMREILLVADSAGINPSLATQIRERLVKAEKEHKLLEVKDQHDKQAAIDAVVKLAKKLKKKSAKKKKEQ